jgi:hypothetical protein
MRTPRGGSNISPGAWETWNIIVTMIELGLDKLKKNPDRDPILRSWEIWRKGDHKRGMVYHIIELLNEQQIIKPVEEDANKYEVQFTRDGVKKLVNIVNTLGTKNRLQRVRLQILTELLDEFDRNLSRTIPK